MFPAFGSVKAAAWARRVWRGGREPERALVLSGPAEESFFWGGLAAEQLHLGLTLKI